MEKTILYLNNKTWYRFIKVIYIFSILIFLVSFNVYNYTNSREGKMDFDKVKIQSAEGKVSVKFETEQTVVFDSSPSQKDIEEVAKRLNLDITKYFSYSLNKADFIIFFLIGNLSILLLFEIIRRAFYYIVLGTIKPGK